eukprot:SAG11_NODE_829_length_6967_cov_7.039196_1_plen_97_part_00
MVQRPPQLMWRPVASAVEWAINEFRLITAGGNKRLHVVLKRVVYQRAASYCFVSYVAVFFSESGSTRTNVVSSICARRFLLVPRPDTIILNLLLGK